MSGLVGRVVGDIARTAKGGSRGAAATAPGGGAALTLEGEIRQRSSVGDRIAFGLGFVLAIGSTAFLVYAVQTSGDRPKSVFSMPVIATGQPLERAQAAGTPVGREPGQTSAVSEPQASSGQAGAKAPAATPPKTNPNGYMLRKAFPGFAILDGPSGQKDVVPGVELPGAGRVVAIKQLSGEWVVETTEGVIRAPSQ